MEPVIETKSFYSSDENIKSSFGYYDEGVLKIYDSYLNYKSHSSEVTIEKGNIEKVEMVNKSPGVFEFAIVILANLIIVAGYFGFESKSILTFVALLILANSVLYIPLFKERWIKINYKEAGETKKAYFRAASPFEIFTTLLPTENSNEKILDNIKK